MRQLPIIWQRLVSAGGTCPRCDATYQHLQSAVVKLREALKPADWRAPVPGTFVKETMNNLVNLGEKMGADPSSWRVSPPW
jgi:hypothetical protein